MGRGRTSTWTIVLTLTVGVLAATPASAQDGTAGTTLGLADQIAAVWPALQRSNGSFSDYVFDRVPGNGGYSEAMLGFTLLDSGIRTQDWGRISAGLRAIDAAVARPRFRSVFQVFAIASAYNLVR